MQFLYRFLFIIKINFFCVSEKAVMVSATTRGFRPSKDGGPSRSLTAEIRDVAFRLARVNFPSEFIAAALIGVRSGWCAHVPAVPSAVLPAQSPSVQAPVQSAKTGGKPSRERRLQRRREMREAASFDQELQYAKAAALVNRKPTAVQAAVEAIAPAEPEVPPPSRAVFQVPPIDHDELRGSSTPRVLMDLSLRCSATGLASHRAPVYSSMVFRFAAPREEGSLRGRRGGRSNTATKNLREVADLLARVEKSGIGQYYSLESLKIDPDLFAPWKRLVTLIYPYGPANLTDEQDQVLRVLFIHHTGTLP